MAAIIEDYCDFETAKFLKEKGFHEICKCQYGRHGDISLTSCNNGNVTTFARPTLQMVMKWLRKVYHIEISITFGFPFIDGKVQYKYFWSVVKVCNNHLEYPMNNPNDTTCHEEISDSYEEAVEAAIKYCLENLI